MAGRSASYGAWARRRTSEPGEVSPAPSLDPADVARYYKENAHILIGVSMTKGIRYLEEDEDEAGNEVTVTVRETVWRHSAELTLRVIEAGRDTIYHLSVLQKGFTPFACDLLIHDIGQDNHETSVDLSGDMFAAQTFIGHLLRNPN